MNRSDDMNITSTYSPQNKSSTPSCNEVQSSDIFVLESLLIIAFSVLSIAGLSLEIPIVWKSGGIVPSNVKLLFLNSVACSALRSIYFFVHALYCLLIWTIRSSVVPMDATICATLGFAYMIFSIIGFYSFFFIGIERLWTTFQFQSLNSSKDDSHTYGLICIFISWLIASATYLGLLTSNSSFSVHKPICYCYINYLWPKSGLTYHPLAMVTIQISTCIFYGLVFAKNRNRLLDFGSNQARQTLSQRFGIWENIRTTKWLTPVTLFHSTVTSLVLVMVNVGRLYFTDGLTAGYMTYLNLCFLIYALENVMVPVLTMRSNINLKDVGRRLFPNLFRSRLFCILLSIELDDDHDSPKTVQLSKDNKIELRKMNSKITTVVDKIFNTKNRQDTIVTKWNCAKNDTTINDTDGPTKKISATKNSDSINPTKKNLDGRKQILDFHVETVEYHNFLLQAWQNA